MKKRLSILVLAATLVLGFVNMPTSATLTVQAAPAAQTGLTAQVLASQLFIRARPSSVAGVLSRTNWGDTLEVLGRDRTANWLKIRKVKDGTVGWVSSHWVKLSRNIARTDLPIVS
jgi:uncharacterized protein YgiM (DUF1202 family)